MAHFREHVHSRTTELRNMLDDARVLIERYQKRNDPELSLNSEQRREWAEQMVVVLGKLGLIASQYDDKSEDDRVRRRGWLDSFVAGGRSVKPIPQDPPGLRVTTIGERADQQPGAASAAKGPMGCGGVFETEPVGGTRMHELFRRATAVFKSTAEASRWGATSSPELSGCTPMQVAGNSAAGLRSALAVLERISAAKEASTRAGGMSRRR